MQPVVEKKNGVTTINTSHLNDKESAKKVHDLSSAIFRINHIAQMIDQDRPIQDYSSEIKASFKDAIKCIEAEMGLIKSIYER